MPSSDPIIVHPVARRPSRSQLVEEKTAEATMKKTDVHNDSALAEKDAVTAVLSSILADQKSTCVPDSASGGGDVAEDIPGVSKGRNRRKANIKARMKEFCAPRQVQPQQPQVSARPSKACQTDQQESEELQQLRGRIAALEQLTRQLLETMRGFTAKASPSTPSSDMDARVSYLERMEAEHSRLFVLKSRADSQNYGGMEEVRTELNVLSSKVDFCLDVLDDEFSGADAEEEAEDEQGDETNGSDSE
eukprot:TRINITY_DN23963_c0_g1_i3.p1 TRINITY_DN23963_c0_g1~~TRINITY_DN23963_c0_g1_i3.p1  ORF type:complete len:271 (-),score=73.04 TRINITY_DN23963_c0_g1_i3:220-963(-)